jgi:hypothetical protein
MIKFHFLKKDLLDKSPIISAYHREWFMKASHGIFSNLRSGLRHNIGIPRDQDLTVALLCI